MNALPSPCPVDVADAPVPHSPQQLLADAEHYLRLPEVDAGPERITQVRAEIARTGTYRHTPDELAIGCRIAWRAHAGCADRMGWDKLQVADERHLTSSTDLFDACVRHLRSGTNGGKIRPTITVFAPDAPDRPGPRIWNEQLVRYAGYPLGGDRVLGDPISSALTSAVSALGWPGGRPLHGDDPLARTNRTAFDVLPVVIETHDEGPRLFELPDDVLLEVELAHPSEPAVAALGLRWYAAPVISNMVLVIGGVTYPAAPFGGWYTSYELAENLGNPARYGLLPILAETLGLDITDPLWTDQALLELTRIVLHSYRRDGVMIADHHKVTAKFGHFQAREHDARREVSADPQVAVPPMSSCIAPTWRARHVDRREPTNFHRRAVEPYSTAAAPKTDYLSEVTP
jgi:nitric-oxide synthase